MFWSLSFKCSYSYSRSLASTGIGDDYCTTKKIFKRLKTKLHKSEIHLSFVFIFSVRVLYRCSRWDSCWGMLMYVDWLGWVYRFTWMDLLTDVGSAFIYFVIFFYGHGLMMVYKLRSFSMWYFVLWSKSLLHIFIFILFLLFQRSR